MFMDFIFSLFNSYMSLHSFEWLLCAYWPEFKKKLLGQEAVKICYFLGQEILGPWFGAYYSKGREFREKNML